MKKWPFWIIMCIISILNGASFFKASLNAMCNGIEDIENPSALFFIPSLWILAALIIVVVNVFTLFCGMRIDRNRTMNPLHLFHLSDLPLKEKCLRITFIVITCFLMMFGYWLFARDPIWALFYALSGGIFLVFLYVWIKACIRHF